METTEPTSNAFPGSRHLPSRWAELGAKALGWLFGDARSNGKPAHHETEPERERKRAAAVSATDSESARKLRFWFSERNRHTL